MATIELSNINKIFGSGLSRVQVLNDVNFKANKGELVLVLGPSGSGKSTFLTIAGGLQTPTSGDVKLNNEEIDSLSKKAMEKLRLNQIGFVLQAYNLIPYLTVKEQFSLVDKVKRQGNLNQADLDELLDLLEIKDTLNKYPSELSGGQNQRVAIARALYTDPEIILADEPTASLDTDRVNDVGELLQTLAKKRNKAVVVVTHDLRLENYADRIYKIMDGKMTEQLPVSPK
ncbi:ABC transporter ATP-binding protein [Companilactobacillus sp.]|jgi:putative ABC transport system ATP-binding protein|uniref:ABC transporter ATP-binding protein n=1 Tax=Companilactobacillus sp. TaxID=2767905 RepID=UPI0025BA0227|nr:ABC transporter ATP-binding protein [Companilactobacillus sp.]MCH4008719.1 ABC transporter ATP-binding protein [Companilactobacillus sp.]MCH4051102.1 ABC transporter ATP-binding protein [Companilactobacillus sp.]MCH4076662.1 ABC transporter ATP-binding protein [Companilactobacillus sp.]MCH4125237.1 ABC transporter ATP-binding protein [Companilactobacillus sp.]MCH4131777.1 ABC transporter ATP-binding protein [Companilactobacillus sp.]